MNAANSARLAEVTTDTLERLAFIFASPVESAPAIEESSLKTVWVEFSGACTLAQDEASCVVFGMPKEAIKLGAADAVVALEAMTHSILQALQAQPNARRAAAGG
jgi:two-component system chemotaxis response regulator CheB